MEGRCTLPEEPLLFGMEERGEMEPPPEVGEGMERTDGMLLSLLLDGAGILR